MLPALPPSRPTYGRRTLPSSSGSRHYVWRGDDGTLRLVLLLGLLLIVAAEIAAFVVVAEQIGFVWAIAILVVVSALGPVVVRRVGIGVLAHTQERLARGEVPTRELLDGLVVLIGGVMICVPGFVGDALGLLLMIGPVRHLLIRAAGHRLARRVQTIPAGRWRVVDARARPVRDDPSPPPERPARPLGPGNLKGGCSLPGCGSAGTRP